MNEKRARNSGREFDNEGLTAHGKERRNTEKTVKNAPKSLMFQLIRLMQLRLCQAPILKELEIGFILDMGFLMSLV